VQSMHRTSYWPVIEASICSTFLAADTEVPGSIPGATKFSVALGPERGPLSLVSTNEELLERGVAPPVKITALGDPPR
jgi:hypothetical protein